MKKNINEDEIGKEDRDMEKLHIDLYLTEDEKSRMSDVQIEYLEDEMREAVSNVKEGQIKICGVYAFEQDDSVEVKAYLVNGSSNSINFEQVPLNLIDSNDEKLAYKIVDLRKVEDLPSHSAKFFKVYFDKNDMLLDKIAKNDWKIVFESEPESVKYLDVQLEKIPKEMDKKEISTFNEFIEELPKLQHGQVSISVFTMTQFKDSRLLMTLVARNTTSEEVELKKLPITIKTKDDDIVLSDVFKLDDCKINSCKARIISLVFKKEIMKIQDFDLTTSKVLFLR